MADNPAILGRIETLRPTIGPGYTSLCEQCMEKLKKDVERRIVEKLNSVSFPIETASGVAGPWDEIVDLMKLWRAQHGG